MTDETMPDETTTESRAGRIARVAIAIVFGLFFAYVLLQGLSTLVNLPPQLELAGMAVPWGVLIALVAISPLVYIAAVWLTRGRALFAQTLIFAVALATAYALWLSVYTLGLLVLQS